MRSRTLGHRRLVIHERRVGVCLASEGCQYRRDATEPSKRPRPADISVRPNPSMRERANPWGGKIMIKGKKGKGTVTLVSIPLEQQVV